MSKDNPGTEPLLAPDTVPAPVQMAPAANMPRQMAIERQGESTMPYVRHFPQVRGGICEFCGIQDNYQPSHVQYKLCPHYRGMQLACSYCDATKSPDDVIGHSVLNITDHPDRPGKLVVCCDSYECTRKHQDRFKVSA